MKTKPTETKVLPVSPSFLTSLDKNKKPVLKISVSEGEPSPNLKKSTDVFKHLRTLSNKGMTTLYLVFSALLEEEQALEQVSSKEERFNRKELLCRILDAITPTRNKLLQFSDFTPYQETPGIRDEYFNGKPMQMLSGPNCYSTLFKPGLKAAATVAMEEMVENNKLTKSEQQPFWDAIAKFPDPAPPKLKGARWEQEAAAKGQHKIVTAG